MLQLLVCRLSFNVCHTLSLRKQSIAMSSDGRRFPAFLPYPLSRFHGKGFGCGRSSVSDRDPESRPAESSSPGKEPPPAL